MSVVSDVVEALRRVVLIDAKLEQLDSRVAALSDDVDGLADALAGVRDRVSRLEGFIEGATAAAREQPKLPRD